MLDDLLLHIRLFAWWVLNSTIALAISCFFSYSNDCSILSRHSLHNLSAVTSLTWTDVPQRKHFGLFHAVLFHRKLSSSLHSVASVNFLI